MLIFPVQRAPPPFPKYWKGTLKFTYKKKFFWKKWKTLSQYTGLTAALLVNMFDMKIAFQTRKNLVKIKQITKIIKLNIIKQNMTIFLLCKCIIFFKSATSRLFYLSLEWARRQVTNSPKLAFLLPTVLTSFANLIFYKLWTKTVLHGIKLQITYVMQKGSVHIWAASW